MEKLIGLEDLDWQYVDILSLIFVISESDVLDLSDYVFGERHAPLCVLPIFTKYY
jgi:hypothetical protein